MGYVPPRWKLTAEQYQRMGEAGIFLKDDPVELLDGELFEMAPIGDDHIGTSNDLTFIFSQEIRDQAIVSPRNPIRLDECSEPQPDLTLPKFRADFYRSGKARPEDVLLLIEIANASLDYDRLLKLPHYAAAGISEVWIVNLVDDRIEVYSEPSGDVYRALTLHMRGDGLAPTALPDLTISVDDILG